MRQSLIRLFSTLGLFTLLTACGGGGSSDGGGSVSTPDVPEGNPEQEVAAETFTVEASVGEGGQITPASEEVAAGGFGNFTVMPDEGYAIDQVVGCNGTLDQNTYTTGTITEDCRVSASFSAITYRVGGVVDNLQGSLTLALEVGDLDEQLTITAESGTTEFLFPQAVLVGSEYSVTVVDQPDGQRCNLQDGFGEVGAESESAILVECTAKAAVVTVSGTIVPAANIHVDSDINDTNASYSNNSSPSLAQAIDTRTTVHGFASATGTGGDDALQQFADRADLNDYYQVRLQQGQVIQLRVVDYDGYDNGQVLTGDLDLYLLDADAGLVTYSNGFTGLEEIIVPESGAYFIRIHAYQGVSKYVLRLMPSESLGTVMGEPTSVDFVPNQMIIKLDEKKTVSAFGAHGSRSSGGMAQSGADGRATLVELNRQNSTVGIQSRSDDQQSIPSDSELDKLNPQTWSKLQTLNAIKDARTQPGVVYAEPNFIRSSYAIPNDPAYEHQWHYAAIGLPPAWDITTASGAESPVVAVIDTGVFLEHPDLQPQLVAGYDFIADPVRARDGDGLDADPDDPGDSETLGQSTWHGTHVAGTIAAATDNGRGIAGVAWGARIMPLRVLGKGGATSYDVVQALRYAAGLENDSGQLPVETADVVNLSLGGPGASLAEQEAYQEVRNAGVIMVAAAGNENSSTPSYPAAYDGVLSVSATDFLGDRAPYSNFGETIHLSAPGGNMAADISGEGYPDGVLSTLVDDTSGSREAAVAFYHGTSMAAPHVAGVVALMKSLYPDLTPGQMDSLLNSGVITDDYGPEGWDPVYGHGHINALKAVQVARDLADGISPPEASPQILVLPQIVNLYLDATGTVTVSSEGGGDPAVTDVSSSASWLQVSELDVNDNGIGTYQLNVDRSDLADGPYQAAVTFSSDTGGTATTQVHIQVGEQLGVGQLSQLYVLLLNAETDEIVASVPAVGEGESVVYVFDAVPAGDYKIMAGSDVDADGVVCQAGESCGAFPTLNRPQVVTIPGQDTSQLDFVADILGAIPSSLEDREMKIETNFPAIK